MVEKIVLHIGMHKTGSSSIQSALNGFDDGTTFYADLGAPNHSAAFVTCFSEKYQSYHVWRKQGLTRDQIETKKRDTEQQLRTVLSRKDRQQIIFSGEGISVLSTSEKEALISSLQREVEDLEVYCYVRDPVSFATSSLQQRIKGNLKSLPTQLGPEYRNRLDGFLQTLPISKVHAIPFDRKVLTGGDVVQDFCTRIGIGTPQSEVKPSNISLSAPATKLLFLFNRSNPCFFGDAVLFHSKQKLARTISKAYFDYEKLSSDFCRCLVDTSEVTFLQKNFGDTFTGWSATQDSFPRDELENWFNDPSDIDLRPLKDLLRKRGVRGNFKDPTALINRLFYDEVRIESNKRLN